MQPDLPPPARPSAPLPPPARQIRPPVPGWLWVAFGLGPVPVWMLICLVGSASQPSNIMPTVVAGFFGGLFSGIPMIAGLALASRFYSGTTARIVAGIGFAVGLIVGLAAILFAGCMCLVSLSNHH